MTLQWIQIRSNQTEEQFAWDIYKIIFYSVNKERLNLFNCLEIKQSGCAGDGYEPENVFSSDSNAIWGGRRDKTTGYFYLEFKFSVKIGGLVIFQGDSHYSTQIEVNISNNGQFWINVATLQGTKLETSFINCTPTFSFPKEGMQEEEEVEDDVSKLYSPLVNEGEDLTEISLEKFSTIPSSKTWIPPHPVSLKDNLQPPTTSLFRPDPNFYNSVNVDGLWICASKQIERIVLDRCCQLIRFVIPLNQRILWGRFRSPKGFKDPGPMRIIILDNRTNEQAGCIPELLDDSTGRNGTSCPFVFTSREDFLEGVGGWNRGKLTAHEMTHGADMVIRQLIDPFFNDLVFQSYILGRHKYQHAKKRLYASSQRDEYLAEALTIALGLEDGENSEYRLCNMSTREQLKKKDPMIFAILDTYFKLPLDPIEWI